MTALLVLGAATLLAAAVFDRRLLDMAHRVARRARHGNARETRAALPALVEAVAAALSSGLSLPMALAEMNAAS